MVQSSLHKWINYQTGVLLKTQAEIRTGIVDLVINTPISLFVKFVNLSRRQSKAFF